MASTDNPVLDPPSLPELDSPGLQTLDALLRDRGQLLERIDRQSDLRALARTLILAIAASCAAFGAALGWYRGGVQVFYAAIKLPLVVLLTAALVTPALIALRQVITRRSSPLKDLALVLTSLALGALLLAATAPLVLLGIAWQVSYHDLILLTVGCCALSGAAGLALYVRGLRSLRAGQRGLLACAALGLIAMVGTQMTWTLRPYLVRPRSTEVPFVRPLEGGLLEAVMTSADSARGIYHRAAAPLCEDDRRGELCE